MSDKSNHDQNKEEQELDEIFENTKGNKFNKAIKKAKWVSVLRNALVSLIVMVILFIGGSIVNRNLVYKMETPIQITVRDFYEIAAPNKYIGKLDRYHGFLSGKNEFTTYKLIEGKVVYSGDGQYSYGLFQDSIGNWIGSGSPGILGTSYDTSSIDMQKYNEIGQREMVFFYPFVSYSQYENELVLLENMESDEIMEMALSFDKAYNMDEVEEMLPEDVTLSWYWIDDLTDKEKERSKVKKITENENSKTINLPDVRSAQTAYGIKAYNESGQKYNEPLKHFVRALKNGKEFDTRYQGQFKDVYKTIAGEDGKITKGDIKVFGVVVTGNTNEMKKLQGLPYIKASSLGVVTERY